MVDIVKQLEDEALDLSFRQDPDENLIRLLQNAAETIETLRAQCAQS